MYTYIVVHTTSHYVFRRSSSIETHTRTQDLLHLNNTVALLSSTHSHTFSYKHTWGHVWCISGSSTRLNTQEFYKEESERVQKFLLKNYSDSAGIPRVATVQLKRERILWSKSSKYIYIRISIYLRIEFRMNTTKRS